MATSSRFTVHCQKNADENAVRDRVIRVLDDEEVGYEKPNKKRIQKHGLPIAVDLMITVGGGLAVQALANKLLEDDDIKQIQIETEGDTIVVNNPEDDVSIDMASDKGDSEGE
jgi:hypothetical protein